MKQINLYSHKLSDKFFRWPPEGLAWKAIDIIGPLIQYREMITWQLNHWRRGQDDN